jgi:hypothetical protein
MKYRILTDSELTYMEDDLKHFLIVNGVHAEEWERLNLEDIDKAIQLVEIFSDSVLQKVYEKLSFLEFRSQDTCMVFNCQPEKMELITIQKKMDSEVDLSTPRSIHDALINNATELQFFKTVKGYANTREKEIHQLLEQGCYNSSKEFWDTLLLVVA